MYSIKKKGCRTVRYVHDVHIEQDDLNSVPRAVYVADKNVAVILRAGHWSMVLSLVSACQISAGSNKNLKVTGGAVTCPRAGSELKPYKISRMKA